MNKIKSIISNYRNEMTLIVFSLVMSGIYFYSHGNISTDTGREAIIPMALLNGNVMYKDILNIYAPLAYYINAILMAIFGIRLESLYIGGVISTIISTIMLFKISTKFLDTKVSYCITLFVACTCFYNSSLFNYIMPYAYAVTYALCFIFCSTYFLLEFLEKKENKYLYSSAFLSGCAFACKVEYVGIPLITLLVSFLLANKERTSLKVFSTICVIPLISYLIPFLQGMSVNEGIEAFNIFLKESTVPSMQTFAKVVGAVFSADDILIWVKSIIFLAVFGFIGLKLQKKTKSRADLTKTLFVLSVIYFLFNGGWYFSPIAVLVAIYLIINFKKLLNDKPILILILCGLFSAPKTFYNTDLSMYGAFTLPLLLISSIVVITKDFSEKFEHKFKADLKTLIVFFLVAGTFSNLAFNLVKRSFYSYPIKTERGRIETTDIWQQQTVKILDFIEKNTTENDKILFLPEGAIFNFLSKRQTDMKMYVLDLPFVETLGDDFIIKGLPQYKYIVMIDGFGLYDFDYPRYYFKLNKITEEIQKKYNKVYHEKTPETEVIILEKK